MSTSVNFKNLKKIIYNLTMIHYLSINFTYLKKESNFYLTF